MQANPRRPLGETADSRTHETWKQQGSQHEDRSMEASGYDEAVIVQLWQRVPGLLALQTCGGACGEAQPSIPFHLSLFYPTLLQDSGEGSRQYAVARVHQEHQ